MNTRRLVILVTFLAVFAMAIRPSLDSDTWWHLRAGQWIIENRSIPQTDPFSFTRFGESWQYPGWLIEVPMYLIYRDTGPAGLNLWTALMVTLAFVFVYHTLSGNVFLRAFVVVLAAAASAIYWAARPHLVTFLLAAVYLWVLEGYRWRSDDHQKAGHRLWWLPVLMVIWANSHGGFVVGFILVGVYAFDALIKWITPWISDHFWEECSNLKIDDLSVAQGNTQKTDSSVARFFLITVLMIIAVCLNPSGPVMLLYPFKTVSIGALSQYIQEWQPPDFHSAQVQPFIWLTLITFGVVGACRRRIALTDFLLFAVFAYLSFSAARNIALFSIAAAPVLSRYADTLLAMSSHRFEFERDGLQTGRISRNLNWAILIMIGMAVFARAMQACSFTTNQAAIARTIPVEAVNFIKSTKPPGRIFNSYNWGGYLLFELQDYPVFIDGRTDLYDDRIVGIWLQIVQAQPGWQQSLDQWRIRLVLVEPETPLVNQLVQAGWKQIYHDQLAVVFQR